MRERFVASVTLCPLSVSSLSVIAGHFLLLPHNLLRVQLLLVCAVTLRPCPVVQIIKLFLFVCAGLTDGSSLCALIDRGSLSTLNLSSNPIQNTYETVQKISTALLWEVSPRKTPGANNAMMSVLDLSGAVLLHNGLFLRSSRFDCVVFV